MSLHTIDITIGFVRFATDDKEEWTLMLNVRRELATVSALGPLPLQLDLLFDLLLDLRGKVLDYCWVCNATAIQRTDD